MRDAAAGRYRHVLMQPRVSGLTGSDDSGASDVLIFRVSQTGLSLVGGKGRGMGWSGIVELPLEEEPLAVRAHGRGRPLAVSEPAPVRVVGPYWASQAVLVPVGLEHLVVFGGSPGLTDPNTFVPIAAHFVADLEQVSPTKLLADELEVVRAVRELVEYRPIDVAATAQHLASKAAEALSCEVGAVLVEHAGAVQVEVVTRDWPRLLDAAAVGATLRHLATRAADGPLHESEIAEATEDALARLILPIGMPAPFGLLVVAHAATRPRGFTNLCQRIGRVLAEAAESLLLQAIAREELAAERDRFAREARSDQLTGLENRVAWEELVRLENDRLRRYGRPVAVVSADIDDLKAVNDREGHPAGDVLIRAAADLLRAHARAADRVARVGGDEFLVLLPETEHESGPLLPLGGGHLSAPVDLRPLFSRICGPLTSFPAHSEGAGSPPEHEGRGLYAQIIVLGTDPIPDRGVARG
jgi:GGDEF domain-containing protein